MSSYSKFNLFVGKYQLPPSRIAPDGQIKLSHLANLRLLRGRAHDDGWREDPNGEPWLVIQDGEFWPVMIQLDDWDVMESREGRALIVVPRF